MKKLLLVFILFASIAKSQSPLSDTMRIRLLEQQIQEIKTDMKYCHWEHQAGVTILVAGILSSGISLFIEDKKTRNGIAIGGGVVSLFGMAFILNSHRWIGIAGNMPIIGTD